MATEPSAAPSFNLQDLPRPSTPRTAPRKYRSQRSVSSDTTSKCSSTHNTSNILTQMATTQASSTSPQPTAFSTKSPKDVDSIRNESLKRNREAASRSRSKKKRRESRMEDTATLLQTHNDDLKLETLMLKNEVLQLKSQMLDHTSCDCHKLRTYMKGFATQPIPGHGVHDYTTASSTVVNVPTQVEEALAEPQRQQSWYQTPDSGFGENSGFEDMMDFYGMDGLENLKSLEDFDPPVKQEAASDDVPPLTLTTDISSLSPQSPSELSPSLSDRRSLYQKVPYLRSPHSLADNISPTDMGMISPQSMFQENHDADMNVNATDWNFYFHDDQHVGS